jgi:DNA-binding response OmpR family regulator
MNVSRVLVVDDDADIRRLVRRLCEAAGHEVSEATDGHEALRALYRSHPDLVVLDVAMPALDGWNTLERIRDLSDVPVLFLTARAGEFEKVRGLKGGADDYVTKPFGRHELSARIEALLRRAGEPVREEARYADGYLELDFGERSVRVDGRDIALTPLEFRLLATFVRHPNQVLSHEQLLEHVWGDAGAVVAGQVKLYVGYLRKKLGRDAPIETVRGFGYRYRAG